MMQARRSLDGRRMYFASHTSTRACIMFHGDSIRFDIITLDNSSSCLMHSRLPSMSIDQHKLSISRPPRSRPLSLPVDHAVVERQACAASHRCRSIRICVRRLVLGRRPADILRNGSAKGGSWRQGPKCMGERWSSVVDPAFRRLLDRCRRSLPVVGYVLDEQTHRTNRPNYTHPSSLFLQPCSFSSSSLST